MIFLRGIFFLLGGVEVKYSWVDRKYSIFLFILLCNDSVPKFPKRLSNNAEILYSSALA